MTLDLAQISKMTIDRSLEAELPSENTALSLAFNSDPQSRSAWIVEALTSAGYRVKAIGDRAENNQTHYLSEFLFEDGLKTICVLENSPGALFVERYLNLCHAPALFLDLNLYNLFLSRFSHSTGGNDINEFIGSYYKDTALPVGDYIVRKWDTEVFQRLYPFYESILAKCPLAFVFTSLQATFAERQGTCPVVKLPLPINLWPEPDRLEERAVIRKVLEVPPTQLVVGIGLESAVLDRELLIRNLVQKLAESKISQGVTLILPILDSANDKKWEALQNLNLRILRVQSQSEWESLHSACDLMCYLRSDALAGPPLGFLVSASRGIPSIVSEVGFGNDLPNNAAIKLDAECKGLFEFIQMAEQNRDFLISIRDNFLEYLKTLSPRRTWNELMMSLQCHSNACEKSERELSALLAEKKQELISRSLSKLDYLGQNIENDFLGPAAASLGWTRKKCNPLP